MLHVNMFDFCFCPVTCRVDCFYRSLVRDNWAIRAILEYWFSGCCNKTCPECFSFRILCKSMSCSVRNVEYMCFSYTNGCAFFCIIVWRNRPIDPGLRAYDHLFTKIIPLTLLRQNKFGSPSGFTRILHRTTMSQICVYDRFALGHQISHTDVESLYKKDEIYYTIRTNLSANHFYRVWMRRPTVVGLVNMQVLSHKSL